MTITAEVTSHTRWYDREVITFRLRYPRKIHAQLLTHRSFSRNAQSSRAMRISDMVRDVRRDPARIESALHGKGMQPSGESPNPTTEMHVLLKWADLMEKTIEFVEMLDEAGWAKEEANRFLEPFAHISTVVTMTPGALTHFCHLRNLEAGAQKAIDVLASKMAAAFEASTPVVDPLHVPFRREGKAPEKWEDIAEQVAFAARVSFDKDARDFAQVDNLRLAERLWNAEPKHASPMEHVLLFDPPIHYPNNLYPRDSLQLRHFGEKIEPDASLADACGALLWWAEKERLTAGLRETPEFLTWDVRIPGEFIIEFTSFGDTPTEGEEE